MSDMNPAARIAALETEVRSLRGRLNRLEGAAKAACEEAKGFEKAKTFGDTAILSLSARLDPRR
ncbi:MAG: hypothetical protein ACU0B9_06845 [Limimaricola soesokkakensis]|uniref:hypothetical protein n=1 Tax=Limimaricola soesokkakensis TaxID=1343159 RepID=UPI00405A3FDB